MTCPLCNDTGYKDHASMLCLDPCVHGEGEEARVRSVAEAPLPETIEGLRRQNSSYRALCMALEAEQAIHTAERRKYHEAVRTLDSEREANAMLTAENERLRQRCEAMEKAITSFLPHSIAIDNPTWADGTFIPLDTSLGELRALKTARDAYLKEQTNG